MALDRAKPEPGQIEPDLKVQEILCRELASDPLEILSVDVQAALDQQLVVPGIRPNHRGPIDREVMTDEKCLFLLTQVGGSSLRMLQKEIMHGAIARFLELDQ